MQRVFLFGARLSAIVIARMCRLDLPTGSLTFQLPPRPRQSLLSDPYGFLCGLDSPVGVFLVVVEPFLEHFEQADIRYFCG